MFTVILCICIGITISIFTDEIMNGKITLIVPLTILLLALVVILVFIYLQPTSGKNLAFSVCIILIIIYMNIANILMYNNNFCHVFLGTVGAIFACFQYYY